MSHLSKYIKLKQAEMNTEITDEILENLKECKHNHVSCVIYSSLLFGEKEDY